MFWLRECLFLIVPTIIAIVVGPFGTYEHLTFGERVIYWFGAMTGVGAIMSLGMQIALTHPGLVRMNYWLLLPLVAAFSALPGAVVILSLEAVFRAVVPTVGFLCQILVFVFLIGTLISGVKYPPHWRRAEIERIRSAASADPGSETGAPGAGGPGPAGEINGAVVPGSVFLRRLRPDIGQDLIRVSVQDHYLEVITRAGKQTLLMRLSDAVRELEDYPGLRVHRSHWVALPAMREISRQKNKWTAHLVDNEEVPVSRNQAGVVRDALERHRATLAPTGSETDPD